MCLCCFARGLHIKAIKSHPPCPSKVRCSGCPFQVSMWQHTTGGIQQAGQPPIEHPQYWSNIGGCGTRNYSPGQSATEACGSCFAPHSSLPEPQIVLKEMGPLWCFSGFLSSALNQDFFIQPDVSPPGCCMMLRSLLHQANMAA